MHATLIFPGITRCGWNSFENIKDSEAVFIPHGLAHIASYAKNEGHSIDVIDMRRLSGWDEFEASIKERSPGVFAVSSMSVDFGTAQEAIKHIKQINHSSTIILGGVHATVAYDDVKDISEIDYIIKGEGEVSFSELLSMIENNKAAERVIDGVSPDINNLPYPDRDLFAFTQGELHTPWLPHMEAPFVSVIASRGCPHKCAFCQPAERAVFGGKARIRNVENVIEELKYLRDRYRFKSLLIHDDYFAFNPSWIQRFCDSYSDNGFTQPFTCQVRSDFIIRNKELVSRMVEVGLSCFMIGFESGSQRMLDFIKKGTTVEMNREAVEICREKGTKIFANYMVGLPTETPEEVFKTIEFINWAKPEYASPAFFTPHPGSELYDYCEDHDLSLIQSYKSYARNPNEPKIKGVDYKFLNFAVRKSTEYKLDQSLEYIKNIPNKNADWIRSERDIEQQKMQLQTEEKKYKSKYFQDSISDSRERHRGSDKNRKSVLVTGGTGFIGSSLVQRLLEREYEVTVLTRNCNHPNAKYFSDRGVTIVQGSVEDRKSLENLGAFHIIYHLAVFQGTEGKQMFDVNVGGTSNMLDVALRGETEKFIFASSIEAQGTTSNDLQPLNEEDECMPVSDYGKSKLEAEQIVTGYLQNNKLDAIIARIGNVYGIGGLSFIHSMAEAVITDNVLLKALPLYGGRIVQPIYIDDLMNAFIKAVEKKTDISGILNFTGHNPSILQDWFRELSVLLGMEDKVEAALQGGFDIRNVSDLKKAHAHINYFMSGDAPDIHRYYTDRKLHEKIGEYQFYNLTKGLAYTLEWYYSNGMFNAYIAA